MMSTAVLEMVDVEVAYGRTSVVHGVSVAVPVIVCDSSRGSISTS